MHNEVMGRTRIWKAQTHTRTGLTLYALPPFYGGENGGGIKKISCSIQQSMIFFLPINVKMPTVVALLTFMSRKNSILGLSEPEKCWISQYFHIYEHLKFHA